MLRAIRELFDRKLSTAREDDPERLVQIAAAALWLEMTRADGDSQRVEHDAVLNAVRATDDFEFTSLINQRFTPAQKERVIEHLWRVAYADGQLSALEEHFVRRIADLLYVSHGAYIAAKLRAEESSRR